MRFPWNFTSLFALVVSGGCLKFSRSLVHDAVTPSSNWVKMGSPSSDEPITLSIALVSPNLPALEKRLYEVSDPKSADYGNYLSQEQLEEFVATDPDGMAAVNQWLAGYGIGRDSLTYSATMNSLSLTVTISKAEEMLDTTFYKWSKDKDGKTITRATSYSLPDSVSSYIEVIHPITTFAELRYAVAPPSANRVNQSQIDSTLCSNLVTPACIQKLYGIPPTETPHPGNSIAVSGLVTQYASSADLAEYLAVYRPDLNPKPNFTVISVNGGTNNQSEPGGEANLDTQMTVGFAPGVQTDFYTAGGGFIEGLLSIIGYLLAVNTTTTPLPTVLTTSYGINEDSNIISTKVATNLCTGYMKLGAIGISVIFSSGDHGVQGNQSPLCTAFMAHFPASCPYVTAVGGTTETDEVAWIYSGGGFSAFFPRPAYQKDAVNAYFQAVGNVYPGAFNRFGRGYPDVSGQAMNIAMVWDGILSFAGGTSASAPTFASVVAILNNDLLAAGRRPLGFLNPFLYSASAANAFNDITIGSNPGCNTTGFDAIKGWDPVTGLGTPNYPKLKAALGL